MCQLSARLNQPANSRIYAVIESSRCRCPIQAAVGALSVFAFGCLLHSGVGVMAACDFVYDARLTASGGCHFVAFVG